MLSARRISLTCTPFVVAVLAASALSDGCVSGRSSLPGSSSRLPYSLKAAALTSEYPGSFEAVDLDGDGIDEEIKFDEGIGGASFLSIARVRPDQLYHLYTRHVMSKGGVIGVTDVTGDGKPELIWWRQESPDDVRVYVDEVSAGEATAELSTLHVARFETDGVLLPDGQWGGSICLKGTYDRDGDGATDALALIANAGITLRPREIVFWDLIHDSMPWRLETGATPSGGASVADVTNDGRLELVIGLESPGNGASAGIWDDGHSYVISVNDRGEPIWSNELAGFSSHVALDVADLDGDGSLEVVTAVSYHSELDHTRPELAVWRGSDGALLDTLRIGCPANVVIVARCEEGMRVFAGSSDGMVRRLSWTPGALDVEREFSCGDAVEDVRPVMFTPELKTWSLAIAMGKGTVALLDQNLSPLAMVDTEETLVGARRLMPTGLSTPVGTATGLIVRTKTETHRYYLERRPLALWIAVSIPTAAIILVLAAVPFTRAAALALLRRWLLPKTTRDEAVEELLSALDTAGHGKLAATSTLRRLVRLTEMLDAQPGGLPEAFEARFADAVSNVLAVGLPGLEAIARLAGRVGMAPAATTLLRGQLSGVSESVGQLKGVRPGPADVAALGQTMDGAVARIDDALATIKNLAESERSSSLGSEMGRVLSARREQLERTEVDLCAPDPAALRSARVLGTSHEIAFVLDNMIGNALEAMEGSAIRRLTVGVEIDTNSLVLRVEDTGKGIPASMHEQIFVKGVSSREGGGHGLAATREILGRRRGKVELLRSAPGKGSVFEITLRLVHTV